MCCAYIHEERAPTVPWFLNTKGIGLLNIILVHVSVSKQSEARGCTKFNVACSVNLDSTGVPCPAIMGEQGSGVVSFSSPGCSFTACKGCFVCGMDCCFHRLRK
jgi:hypothetical protein